MLPQQSELVLQRVPDLTVQLDASNMIYIGRGEGRIDCGPHTLAILDTFYQPRSLSDALELLKPRVSGIQAWIDLTSSIMQLYQLGVLLDQTQIKPTVKAAEVGYDTAPIHIAMLNDRKRVESFLAGIREVVQPGDIVLDVGTGSGIFAVAAAQAGARHVYAVEANVGIARLAEAVFAANGLADRITIIQGWSNQIELPERADVLVSEMVGNEPMADYVLEVMSDAHKRLLKPNARLIPDKVVVYGLPVVVPREELAQHIFMPETIRNWRTWYNIDFQPLLDASHNQALSIYLRPYKMHDWPTLSDPIILADIDLQNVQGFLVDTKTTFTTTSSGMLSGLLIYFETRLGPTTTFSLHPSAAGEDTFRYSPVWIIDPPLEVSTGEQLRVNYTYGTMDGSKRIHIERT